MRKDSSCSWYRAMRSACTARARAARIACSSAEISSSSSSSSNVSQYPYGGGDGLLEDDPDEDEEEREGEEEYGEVWSASRSSVRTRRRRGGEVAIMSCRYGLCERGVLFSDAKRREDSLKAGGRERERFSANSLLHDAGRSKLSLNRAASGDGEHGNDPMGLSRN